MQPKVDLPLGNFSFIGNRRTTFTISALLFGLALGALAFMGLNLGVDFAGGSVLELAYSSPVAVDEVKEVLAGYPEMEGSQVLRLESDEAPVIRIKSRAFPGDERRDKLYSDLENLGEYEVALLDQVSPVIGRELLRAGAIALGLVFVGMILYITIRFEFKFAIVAIVALLHDAVITLGLFSVLQVEVGSAFIAAILTIVGYSVNDTIVIFDRIRENLKYRRVGEDLSAVADKSLRQTLMRSLATSATTFAAVASIYLFGGMSIKNFTLALLFGVVIGTYSSIFLASPLWVLWQERAGGS